MRLRLNALAGELGDGWSYGPAFAGLYGEPAMALADDVARACPAECWLNPVKLICDMFNRLYFFEDLGPFTVRTGALVLMALVFVAAATLIFGRSRYEHL